MVEELKSRESGIGERCLVFAGLCGCASPCPIPHSPFPIPVATHSPFPIPHSRRATRARGFTLFEMLVVLVLISIAMAAVSMSVARSLTGAKVNAVSRDLAAALRYTRGQAIVKGEEKVIEFNLADWTYKVPDHAPVELPEGMELHVRTAAEEQVDADTWGMRFYPDGSSTGGRVTVVRGAHEWRINVSWLTGEVRTEEVSG